MTLALGDGERSGWPHSLIPARSAVKVIMRIITGKIALLTVVGASLENEARRAPMRIISRLGHYLP
jgi:hypothetical protein